MTCAPTGNDALQEIAAILAAGFLRLLAKSSAEGKEPVQKQAPPPAAPLPSLAIHRHRSDESNHAENMVSASPTGG